MSPIDSQAPRSDEKKRETFWKDVVLYKNVILSEGERPSRRTPMLAGMGWPPGFLLSSALFAQFRIDNHDRPVVGILRLGRSPSLRVTGLISSELE